MVWATEPIHKGSDGKDLPAIYFFDHVVPKDTKHYPGQFRLVCGGCIGDPHPKIRPSELTMVRGDEYLWLGQWKPLSSMAPKRPCGKCKGSPPYSWPDCEDKPDDVKTYEDEGEVVEEVVTVCEETPTNIDDVPWKGGPARVPGRFGYILGTSSRCTKDMASPPDECAVDWVDNPGFNRRLAATLSGDGTKLYVAGFNKDGSAWRDNAAVYTWKPKYARSSTWNPWDIATEMWMDLDKSDDYVWVKGPCFLPSEG